MTRTSSCGPRCARRRRATFWWAVAAGYVVLSLGPGSFFFALYERLPLGSAFRGSARLLWVVALALAMAAALGAEEIVRRLPRRLGWAVAGSDSSVHVLPYPE